MLFLLFDFDCNESTSVHELITIFMCLTIGFCKLTETEIPPNDKIETYAKLVGNKIII